MHRCGLFQVYTFTYMYSVNTNMNIHGILNVTFVPQITAFCYLSDAPHPSARKWHRPPTTPHIPTKLKILKYLYFVIIKHNLFSFSSIVTYSWFVESPRQVICSLMWPDQTNGVCPIELDKLTYLKLLVSMQVNALQCLAF